MCGQRGYAGLFDTDDLLTGPLNEGLSPMNAALFPG